jgi:hypothetical protein
MPTTEEMYAELKPEIGALANQLFELSELFLRKTGNFLPHGAVLKETGEVQLVAATPDGTKDKTNSVEVLPILHEGLRAQVEAMPCRAVAVAENVTVTQEGQRPTEAIKVLFEHQRGLTVALYLPFKKKFLRGYEFGSPFSKAAEPEVLAWRASEA